MKRRGFTLVELTVVLLIIAIVASVVTLNLSGPISRAKLEDVIEKLKNFDAQSRSIARLQDKVVRMEFDIPKNRIKRLNEKDEQLGRVVQFPERFKIVDLLVKTEGPVTVSKKGLSRSYAVKIEDNNGLHRWIMFAGLTGESLELEDEQEVQEIFDSIEKPQWPDAG